MTNEEKKEYLSSYCLQQARITRLNELMVQSPEKRNEYLGEISVARECRNKIERQIEAVDGGILSEILFQKYLCLKTLEEISYNLHYSHRQIERLHKRALEKFTC